MSHPVPIRVIYSDTTYDVVVGENLETHKIVAAVIDYNTYQHQYTHTNDDPHILYIPSSAFIEINLDNPAHVIPIIKHAPIIAEIANHPATELIIISPCYNTFYLIQKMVPNKRLVWQQQQQTKNIPTIDASTLIAQTPVSTVLSIAKSILSTSSTPCNIEYVNMSDPDFAEHIRHSPTRTRFFKVCSWNKIF